MNIKFEKSSMYYTGEDLYNILSTLTTADIFKFLQKHAIVLLTKTTPETLTKIIVLTINKYLFEKPLLRIFTFTDMKNLFNEINALKANQNSSKLSINIDLDKELYFECRAKAPESSQLSKQSNAFILHDKYLMLWYSKQSASTLKTLITLGAQSIQSLAKSLNINERKGIVGNEEALNILAIFLHNNLLDSSLEYFAKCLVPKISNGNQLVQILGFIPDSSRKEIISNQESYWENTHNSRCRTSFFMAKSKANENIPLHNFLKNGGNKHLLKMIFTQAEILEVENLLSSIINNN